MSDALITLGLILIVIGYLWGISLAFKKSIGTGIVTLVLGPILLLTFLLLIRPKDFQKPLGLIAGGVLLGIFSNLF